MKSKLLVLSTLCLILIFQSCSSERVSPIAKYIPKNVPAIFTINIGNLVKKSGTDIGDLDAYRDMMREFKKNERRMANMLDGIVEDPMSSGIDFRKPFYLMPYMDGDVMFFLLYAQVSNEKKFTTLMEEFGDNLDKEAKFEMDDAGDYQYFEFRNYDNSAATGIIGWNNKVVIAMLPTNDTRYYRNERQDDYRERLEDLIEIEPRKSLAKNKSFAKFSANKRDITMWLSYEEMMEIADSKDMEDDLNIDLSDSYLKMFLDFKKDEIVISSTLEAGKALKREMGKTDFFDKGVDKDFFKLLPASTIFSGSLALRPEALLDLLDELNILKEANDNWKKDFGFTFDEMLSSIEGDVVFGLTDLKHEAIARQQLNWDTYEMETVNIEVLQPKFTVFGQLKDDKLAKKILRETKATRKSDYYELSEGSGMTTYVKAEDNLFLFTNDKDIIKGNYDKIRSGASMNLATKNAAMMHFGFNYTYSDDDRGDLNHIGLGLGVQRFYELLQDNYEGISLVIDNYSSSEIRLTSKSNEDKNSLATLIRIIEEMTNEKANKRYFDKYEDDLTEPTIFEPTDSVDVEEEAVEEDVDDKNTGSTEGE
jgi:hypothetical protein